MSHLRSTKTLPVYPLEHCNFAKTHSELKMHLELYQHIAEISQRMLLLELDKHQNPLCFYQLKKKKQYKNNLIMLQIILNLLLIFKVLSYELFNSIPKIWRKKTYLVQKIWIITYQLLASQEKQMSTLHMCSI